MNKQNGVSARNQNEIYKKDHMKYVRYYIIGQKLLLIRQEHAIT